MAIDTWDRPPDCRSGYSPTGTIHVVAGLRCCLREGTPWRSLIATESLASGSTLQHCSTRWVRAGLLLKVHALLVSMLPGTPT
jgi:transposase